MPQIHSDLPIITPDPPRKTASEKYGSLYYLGAGGLVVVLALVGWFGWGLWTLRHVFHNVYVLHDASRSETDRIEAAYALSRDPRLAQKQAWEMALRRPLPPLARYVLAESLTERIVAEDSRAYLKAVAYSDGWPVWLRLALLRPVAYAAGQGYALLEEPLASLRRDTDPVVVLWADFAQAAEGQPRSAEAAEARAHLERVASENSEQQPLAAIFLDALAAGGQARKALLDSATAWTRRHHPEVATLWNGWEERDGRLFRKPAPNLHLDSTGRSGNRRRMLPRNSSRSGTDETANLAAIGNDDVWRRYACMDRGNRRAGYRLADQGTHAGA